MGNIFSICKCKNLDESLRQPKVNISEYKTLQIEDKIYILFVNKTPGDCFEI